MAIHDRRARIGIIGAGWWSTTAHLPTLAQASDAEVVALADLNEQRLHQAGDAFGIQNRYLDYRQLLERERLDGVIVATTHASHFGIAADVLQHGLALLLEKPMVLHAAEARRLVEQAQQHDAPLIVGYPWHFVEQHQQLRALIAQGRLGRIQMVSCNFASMVVEYFRGNPEAYRPIFAWKITGPSPTTYSEPRVAGGGQGHLQVTHSAGLLFWLTGLRPLSVGAFMENHDLKVDLCDAIAVRFDGGAVGTLASTGAIPAAHSGNQQLEYRIYGTEGFALLDVMEGSCRLFWNDGSVEALAPVPPGQGYPQHTTSRHLVDVLHGRVENTSPGEIGWRTVELLDAAYVSAAEGRIVAVEELYDNTSVAAAR
jgi:predicted dehydrogenase